MISTKFYAVGLLLALVAAACGSKTEGNKVEPVAARPPSGEVNLSIDEVSVRDLDSLAIVEMTATLDNGTGEILFVVTNFYSPFDGLSLVVESGQNIELLSVPYIYHQSPHLPEGEGLPLKSGRNTERMGFPLEKKLPPGEYRVRLEGGLPGTEIKSGLKSNWVEVVVELIRGHLIQQEIIFMTQVILK